MRVIFKRFFADFGYAGGRSEHAFVNVTGTVCIRGRKSARNVYYLGAFAVKNITVFLSVALPINVRRSVFSPFADYTHIFYTRRRVYSIVVTTFRRKHFKVAFGRSILIDILHHDAAGNLTVFKVVVGQVIEIAYPCGQIKFL